MTEENQTDFLRDTLHYKEFQKSADFKANQNKSHAELNNLHLHWKCKRLLELVEGYDNRINEIMNLVTSPDANIADLTQFTELVERVASMEVESSTDKRPHGFYLDYFDGKIIDTSIGACHECELEDERDARLYQTGLATWSTNRRIGYRSTVYGKKLMIQIKAYKPKGGKKENV